MFEVDYKDYIRCIENTYREVADNLIGMSVSLAEKARREGLLSLEKDCRILRNNTFFKIKTSDKQTSRLKSFFVSQLMLVVKGTDPLIIQRVANNFLNWALIEFPNEDEQNNNAGISFYELLCLANEAVFLIQNGTNPMTMEILLKAHFGETYDDLMDSDW